MPAEILQHVKYMYPAKTLWAKLLIRIFCWTPLWNRERGQSVRFPPCSTHRSTLQLYCAIIRGWKGFPSLPAGKCRKRRASSAARHFSPLLKFVFAKEHNALLAQFINGHIHRPRRGDVRDSPVKSSGVVKCRLWPALGTPLSLFFLQ